MSTLRKLLFFDLEISGHHLEYMVHIIKYGIEHSSNVKIILFTHPDFLKNIREFNLQEISFTKDIEFVSISRKELQQLTETKSVHKRAKKEFCILKRYLKTNSVDMCYLMNINKFQYILGSRVGRSLSCKIRGIFFNPMGAIGNELWRPLTFLRKYLMIIWMFRNKKVNKLYILNNDNLAASLNKWYLKKDSFVSLPDPILLVPNTVNSKEDPSYYLTGNNVRFLLFGSLSGRKGIFLIINALKLVSDDTAKVIEVLFAGRITDHERKKVINSIDDLKKEKPEIVINLIDEFIPYNMIPNLFSNCDCVLVPYESSQLSSGIIGHAAFYEKPVIGPEIGLIGKLIQKYKLGKVLREMNELNLSIAIQQNVNYRSSTSNTNGMKRYVEERHPSKFVETLFV